MLGDFSVEAIDFDEDRHCVFPSSLSGFTQTLPIADKINQFIDLVQNPAADRDALVRRFELLIAPIAIPRTSLDRADNGSKIIIMSPTTGHTPTAYDFSSREDQMIFFSNQVLATGWEVTRQALLSLGATVKIADDIYEETGIAPVMAADGVQLPVQQIFARDPGVVLANKFLAVSEEALYRTTIDVLETSNGIRIPRHSRADKFAQLTAGLKPRHAQSISDAYRRAGADFKLHPIDAFFEAGDVIPDPKKGIVLIGNDSNYNQKYRSLHSNQQSLRAAFSAVAGERSAPVFIERPFTEYSEDRGQGERFHLDCFMCRLPKGELLIDPRYTTPASMDLLKKIYGDDLITITPDNPTVTEGPVVSGDVPNCIANLVAVGTTLLMPSCSGSLKDKLQNRGYSIVTAKDLGVTPGFLYMRGGGMHCITNDFPSLT